jgi:hypothetical protein
VNDVYTIFVTPLNDIFGDSTGFYGTDRYNVDPSNNPTTFVYVPIQTRVILNEIGDGTNDFMLRKMHIEALPDPRWTSGPTWQAADYYAENDPQIILQLRANPWRDSVVAPMAVGGGSTPRLGDTLFDIMQLNMAVTSPDPAVGSVNPWQSILTTPSGTTHTQQFSGSQNNLPRESITLNAPENSTFRRLKVEYRSKITAVLRSIVIQISRYERKGWG